MKKLFVLAFAIICTGFSLEAQTIDELKAQKAAIEAQQAEAQATADGFAGEIAGLQKQINLLSGWRKGIGGILGLNFSNASNWAGFPNPNASSSNFTANITGFANLEREKYFWDNKLLVNQGWLSLDPNDGVTAPAPGLFTDGSKTLDVVNLSSLAGYKLSNKLALSGLGELNTSITNFFEPGTIDIGIGATYTPVENFRIVFHPINLNASWLAAAIKDSEGFTGDNPTMSVGAKLRADYTRDFNVVGKKVAWSSTFTGFMPYTDAEVTYIIDGESKTISASNWTWINSLSFEIWRGIGVGVGFGLRDASFESEETQSYYNVGLSYGF